MCGTGRLAARLMRIRSRTMSTPPSAMVKAKSRQVRVARKRERCPSNICDGLRRPRQRRHYPALQIAARGETLPHIIRGLAHARGSGRFSIACQHDELRPRVVRTEFRRTAEKVQSIRPALLRPRARTFECRKRGCGLRVVTRRGAFDQRETLSRFEWRVAPHQKTDTEFTRSRSIAGLRRRPKRANVCA